MRIALVALHFAEYTGRLALALAEEHDVLLVLNLENAHAELTVDLLTQLGAKVQLELLSLRRRRDPRVLGTSLVINRIVKHFDPDVLHMQEMHPMLGGWSLLSIGRRLPAVLTVHDAVGHSGEAAQARWQQRVVTWFRCRASQLIAHGPTGQATLESEHRELTGRVNIVPHGVLGRTELGPVDTPCEPRTFLFFGRIHAYKGLGYFLDAGDILRHRGHDVRLLVAGTGEDLRRYRAQIEESPWVELHDRFIEPLELPAMISRAAAVVLPYTDGTQSGVCAMAFAYGRPVIATRVGDLPDVVIDGRTGLTVPPRNAAALSDAMEQLLIDVALRERLAAQAMQFARDKLSWSRVAALTYSVYDRALRDQLLRTKHESLG